MNRFLILAPAALLLTSCAIGPNYQRPAVTVPPQFRGAAPDAAASDKSLADANAFDLFKDPGLTALLKTALSQNYDLSIAAERVLEERAQYGITRSAIFPSLDGTAALEATRSSSVGSFTFIPKGLNLSATYTQSGLSLSWEADFWGRLRRLTEAARAQYLATEEGRHAITASVVADVASNYLNLLELDKELAIGLNTKSAAERGLQLIDLRHQRGAATGLDVRQAQELLYTATAQIAATERDRRNRKRAQRPAGAEPFGDPSRNQTRQNTRCQRPARGPSFGTPRTPARYPSG